MARKGAAMNLAALLHAAHAAQAEVEAKQEVEQLGLLLDKVVRR